MFFGTTERRAVWLLLSLAASVSAAAQSPKVTKIEPPSWWIGHTINPVRILIRGSGLNGARISARSGVRITNLKTNAAGTYLFADLQIAANAKPGSRQLTIATAGGSTSALFEILKPLPTAGRFQGFSPSDVMYLIMIDRFSDGDASNNDPPQSRGLFDRKNE